MRLPGCNLYPDAPTFILNGPTEPESSWQVVQTERLVCHEEATNSTFWRIIRGYLCGVAGFCESCAGGREFSPIDRRRTRFAPRPFVVSLTPRRAPLPRALSVAQLLPTPHHKPVVLLILLSDHALRELLLRTVELRFVRVFELLQRSGYDVSDIHSILFGRTWRLGDGCAVHYR